MPAKFHPPNGYDIIKEYKSGKSQKEIAEELGISRRPIHRILVDAGVELRSMKESIRLGFSKLSPERRREIASYAFRERRRKGSSEEELRKRALTKQRTLSKIGDGERLLASWLEDRGLNPILQFAFHRYNIDIAIHPVAVELVIGPQNRLRDPRDRRRTKYLTEHGWHVIYVWVTKRHFLTQVAADHIVAFRKQAQSDPSSVGQYRVIRGSGELYTSGRGDLD